MTMKHTEIISAIQSAVKETVNGKIDDISTKFNAYVERDEAWKKESQPAIDAMKNLTVTKSTLISLGIFVTTIGGAIFIVEKVINYWKP